MRDKSFICRQSDDRGFRGDEMSNIYYTKRNEDVISLAEDEKTILGILRNNDVCNDPRDWDNLGTMVCWHNRYCLGDKHKFGTPQDFKDFLEKEDDFIYLPLYLYDHSGITISTNSFHDIWDSGKVGWIYTTKEIIKKDQNVEKITDALIVKVKDILRSEVKVYDQYLTGDVYGFSVEDKDGNVLEDEYGFFGENFEENGLKEALGKYSCLLDKLKPV